jgi:hypothetical protein
MSRVLSTDQEAVRSPYDSLYQHNYDGIHRMLSRGWCGRWRGLCIRVAFHCEVIQQTLETTSRLPLARLDFGDHSGSSSLLITVRSVVVISARVEFN